MVFNQVVTRIEEQRCEHFALERSELDAQEVTDYLRRDHPAAAPNPAAHQKARRTTVGGWATTNAVRMTSTYELAH